MANNERMKGTVVRVFLNRGFAFVRGDDGVSRFLHARDVKNPLDFDHLYEGAGVEFTPRDFIDTNVGGNKLRAIDVEVIKT
jgi:cold shock CspA family protein